MNYFIINSDDFNKRVDIMNTNKETTTTTQKKYNDAPPEFQEKMSLESAQFVKKMLKDIPKDLRDIFTPKSAEELQQLEVRLIGFSAKEKERQQIIALQQQFNLPVRPNMSLRDTAIRVRLELLRRHRQNAYNENNYTENDENPGTGSSSK